MNDRLLWAAFAMIGVLVLISGIVVLSSVLFAPVSNDAVKAMIEGKIIARGIVLFLIIPLIAILCLRERITGEAALAALSAIAGYILGGATSGGP